MFDILCLCLCLWLFVCGCLLYLPKQIQIANTEQTTKVKGIVLGRTNTKIVQPFEVVILFLLICLQNLINHLNLFIYLFLSLFIYLFLSVCLFYFIYAVYLFIILFTKSRSTILNKYKALFNHLILYLFLFIIYLFLFLNLFLFYFVLLFILFHWEEQRAVH
jgi:hypothetical protein